MSVPSITDSLFAVSESRLREQLAASPMGDLLPGEAVVDLFCGAGGWGEGLKLLSGGTVGVGFAINHWDRAITTHALNNPACSHTLGDAWRARPRAVIGAGTKLGLLLASAACTTHSRARGSAPISQRVHMLGWCIARWMREVTPRVVLIENVPEWQEWGPTVVGPDGVRRQDPGRKGQHFRRWWRYCTGELGYVMERRVLHAPDYGEASRRKRLIIIARRDGAPIVWPEVTHGVRDLRAAAPGRLGAGADGGGWGGEARAGAAVPQAGVRAGSTVGRRRCEVVPDDGVARGKGGANHFDQGRAELSHDHRGLSPQRTAADILDWSDLGTSIFARKRALRPKTQKRIAEGIRRYVIADPAPFLLRVTQGEGRGWHVAPIDAPMPTQTTRQDLAVCAPVIAPQNSGVYGSRVDEAGPTVTTKGHQAVIAPIISPAGGPSRNPARADEPYHTILGREDCGVAAPVMCGAGGSAYAGGGNHGLIAPLVSDYYGNSEYGHRADEPLRCVTTLDRHAGINILLADPAARLKRALQTAKWLRRHLGEAVSIEEESGLAYVEIGGARRYFLDILFRMLRVLELAAAMGFPAGYQWPRSQRDAVRMIGNAVSVRKARAVIGAALPGLERRTAGAREARAVA